MVLLLRVMVVVVMVVAAAPCQLLPLAPALKVRP